MRATLIFSSVESNACSESESLCEIKLLNSVLYLSASHYAWNVGFVLFNRPNPRLWEIVQQKAPMYCHGNFGGWRFEGECEYMLNEVK